MLIVVVEGGAKYIISDDKHLLELKRYQSTHIIQPAHFLQIIARCQRRYNDKLL